MASRITLTSLSKVWIDNHVSERIITSAVSTSMVFYYARKIMEEYKGKNPYIKKVIRNFTEKPVKK